MTSILQSSVFKLVILSLVAIAALVATSRCAALRSRATAVALTGGSYSLSLVKQQSGNENSK
jgi:hypothetical protein